VRLLLALREAAYRADQLWTPRPDMAAFKDAVVLDGQVWLPTETSVEGERVWLPAPKAGVVETPSGFIAVAFTATGEPLVLGTSQHGTLAGAAASTDHLEAPDFAPYAPPLPWGSWVLLQTLAALASAGLLYVLGAPPIAALALLPLAVYSFSRWAIDTFRAWQMFIEWEEV